MLQEFKRYAVLAAAFWVWPQVAACALEFELEAGPTRFGSLEFARLGVVNGADSEVTLEGISHDIVGPLGDLVFRCRGHTARRCIDGLLVWNRHERSPLEMTFRRGPGHFRLAHGDTARVRLSWSDAGFDGMTINAVPLAWVPSSVMAFAGLAALSGNAGGEVQLTDDHARAVFRIEQLAFDTPDGRFAGGGLAIGASLDWRFSENRFDLRADWKAGEVLLGPLYLPGPQDPVELNITGQRRDASLLAVERLQLQQAQVLELNADALVEIGDALDGSLGTGPANGFGIRNMRIEIEHASLGPLWRQGLESIAGAYGWGQLDLSGRLNGSIRVVDNAIVGAGLRLTDTSVDDAANRVRLTGLGAWLDWESADDALGLGVDWQDAQLFRIPFGPAALALRSTEEGVLELADAFRLPVLDGALVLERFEWRDWRAEDRKLAVDARLEPVDLAALTRTLGWPEFGGSLSGNFPGIGFSGGVMEVQGGLDIDLFGGHARINGLSVERPFGSLPALAADVVFEALDLEQVTRAFEFGRMLGLMSGYITNLRLLDWQPVGFDAWFETLEDSPEREISQQAVNSISSLSGGGGAAISGTLLRWFEDFPYRKFGLGCRLAENVCRMRGLRDIDNGGYMILEGRLIPRLDIVGYQRRVDWPRLLAQLAAATESAD